jgi:DNA-binding FrmR family transcriptional regulator
MEQKAYDKKRITDRLSRIEGQIRGIKKMIESNESCANVAQQMAAVRSAMNKSFFEMVGTTIENNCLNKDQPTNLGKDKLSSLIKILIKYS